MAKPTRSSSSGINFVIEDFIDQRLIERPQDEICSFNHLDANKLLGSGQFPSTAVISAYDRGMHADFCSKTWVCFYMFPFSLGVTYPFPPLVAEFFKVTSLSYHLRSSILQDPSYIELAKDQ